MKWNKTKPPKRIQKPVTLRYSSGTTTYQGKFVWCERENAFVQCIDGPDGIALYLEDGYKILGWRD